MPRVHVVKARKDYPDQGIKKGDTYYHWTFRNRFGKGTLVRSKERPKPSQLTRSEYLSRVYSLQEQYDSAPDDTESLEGIRDEILHELEDIQRELEEKLENMPEGLRENSDSGQLLQERLDNLDNAISELEDIDFDWDEESVRDAVKDDISSACDWGEKPEDSEVEDKVEEKRQEYIDDKWTQIQDALGGLS